MAKTNHSPATMYAILTSNAAIAREATLTGVLSDSTKVLVSAYNRILRALREMDCGLDELLFEEVQSDITIDEIGALSEHLSKFLEVKFGCGILDEADKEAGMEELLKKLFAEKENLEKELTKREKEQP